MKRLNTRILAIYIMTAVIFASFSISSSEVHVHNDLYHYGPIYSINVYDYDGDGSREIALGTERGLTIIEYDRSAVASHPCDIIIGQKSGHGTVIQSSVYKGDIKSDGVDDIIFGTFDKFIYFYDDSDTSSEPQSVYVGGEVLSSILVDYDGDGVTEYVFGTTEGKLEAYSWNGTAFAKERDVDLSLSEENYVFDLVVSDVAGDAGLEVIVGVGYEDASEDHTGKCYILDDSFSMLWEQTYGEYVFDVDIFNGNVVCSSNEVSMIDPDTGVELWDYTIGDYTFIYADDQIYAGSQNERIYSLDQNGNLNWGDVNVGSEVNGFYVEGGIIVVASDDLRTYDNSNGSLLHMLDTSAKVNQAVIVDGEVLAGTDDGTLYRLEEDLDPLWPETYMTRDNVMGLDVSQDLIVTGNADRVLRVYGIDSTLLWEEALDGKVSAVATYGDYVFCGDYTGNVVCYENGIEQWRKDYNCQVRDMDVYDMFNDGTPDLVVGLGKVSGENILFLDVESGAETSSAEIPGWVNSVGCGDIDRNDFHYGEVVVGSTDLYCIDKDGNELWSTDLGSFTNDAVIFEEGDYSCAYAVSVGGSSNITALNLDGDVLWQHIVNGEDLLSVCAGDLDGDGWHEVMAGGDNNIYTLDELGNLIDTDYQFRDVPALESLGLSTDGNGVAAYAGAYGVDHYHSLPTMGIELRADFGTDRMQLYMEADHILEQDPVLKLKDVLQGVSTSGEGWLSSTMVMDAGQFSIDIESIIGDETSFTIDLGRGAYNGTSANVDESDWSATVTTTTSVAGDYYYMVVANDPRLGERDAIGEIFTLALDTSITGALESIDLTNTYDESELPSGITEDMLALYHWDSDESRFLECESSVVDTVSNTVSGEFTSNGTYAILANHKILALQQGWNLISFNYTPDNTDLNTIMAPYPNIDYIYRWNAVADYYEYSYYEEGWGWEGDFDSIDSFEGYWVYVNENPQWFSINGDNTAITNIDIFVGWNLVSWPKCYEMNIGDALEDLENDIDYVYRWNEVDKRYEYSYFYSGYGWNGDFNTFEPGVGYWIHSFSDCTWIIP